MAETIQGTEAGSLVHRFITSGKPGYCELCNACVEKLEAHHIRYSPEKTIKLCHACHHKTHFWPNRLKEKEKLQMLKKVYPVEIAEEMSRFKFASVSELAKIIAPSKKEFIHAAQKLEQKKIDDEKSTGVHHTVQKSAKVVCRDEHIMQAIREIPHLNEKKKTI
jgi:hypothetical protein